jgi:mono/diheme cytochrome c family protein
MRASVVWAVATACISLALPAQSDEVKQHMPEQQSVVHGAPLEPTTVWMIAAGGRIYDNWWEALDRKKPEGANPGYPESGKQSGATTWRCVECHGWDYKGKDGLYGSGEHYTGIKGINNAHVMRLDAIRVLLRAKPHGYSTDMIRDDEILRVAAFIREGQHDPDLYIDRVTSKPKGDPARGAGIFQTICAICHGFDGRLLDWGTKEDPGFVGTEAREAPAEVLHKIRNAHPGAAMINLRAFAIQDAVDVLTYTQSLPAK